ncbi:MAG: HAD family hydrolase [Acidobacteria bacterium]|nr:HAD family hydrolase [Acidobacteriota bacterium]MYH21611.1 HAD family hydrolase [Acidobacteriota bacterium]MYK80740.1 HAD family hydrolase [Acidobacteriota bacterium]
MTATEPGRTPLAGITAVSFDVDGTLYSDRFLRTRVAWEAIRRGSLRDLGTLRNRRDPASGAAARLAAEARILIPVIRRLGPRPGVAELLERLHRYTLVAVSDFDPEARLEALGLRGVFERVYAAERHGALKPDPRVFHAALADLGIPAAALLHVGNRADTDGAAARAAGCRVLILGREFTSFDELRALLTT